METEKKEVISDLNLVEQAQKIAERIEKGNEQLKQLLDRQEQLEAKRVIGGRASAGTTAPTPIDPAVKLKEDTKNYFKGTAVERYIK